MRRGFHQVTRYSSRRRHSGRRMWGYLLGLMLLVAPAVIFSRTEESSPKRTAALEATPDAEQPDAQIDRLDPATEPAQPEVKVARGAPRRTPPASTPSRRHAEIKSDIGGVDHTIARRPRTSVDAPGSSQPATSETKRDAGRAVRAVRSPHDGERHTPTIEAMSLTAARIHHDPLRGRGDRGSIRREDATRPSGGE